MRIMGIARSRTCWRDVLRLAKTLKHTKLDAEAFEIGRIPVFDAYKISILS